MARTAAPCGMPKGESLVSLEAGSTVNVSWHLGYPHRGESALLRWVDLWGYNQLAVHSCHEIPELPNYGKSIKTQLKFIRCSVLELSWLFMTFLLFACYYDIYNSPQHNHTFKLWDYNELWNVIHLNTSYNKHDANRFALSIHLSNLRQSVIYTLLIWD